MIQELVYTSAPRGLQPGKSGFCTVACTHGMTPNLFAMLESMSGYRHLSMECAPSPTVYSYHPISLGGRVWQVLSRISAYGLDYTQRANKLADHWVLDPSEGVGRNAARLLQPSQNLLRSEWRGDPRWLPNPMPLPMPSPQTEQEMKRCLHWKLVTGDEGWAGVLCDNAVSNRVTTIIVPPLFDILTLFEEALSLLPAMTRWQVSFSTYLTRLPPGVPCLWRGVVDGTPEADAARDGMHTSANLVDLCRPLPALSTTGLESSLYVQQARSANAPRVLVSSSPLVSDVDDSFPPPDPSFIRVNAGTQEFSGPITGVTNASPHNPASPLRDGISPRLEPTSSSGDGYESVPERPNLAAAACSPDGYAASRQKIFGKVPELPATAKSKRRRENWIVGMLLVGFLLGVCVAVGWCIWYFVFRPQGKAVTQEPAATVVSQKPKANEPPESAPQKPTPPELAPQKPTPPELAPPAPTPPEWASPEWASPELASPEQTPPELASPEQIPPESAPPKTDEPEQMIPEVFVFFKNGGGQATKIESPKGTICESVSCEEGYTGPICRLTRMAVTEKQDKDGKTITEEKQDGVLQNRDVPSWFEIKDERLYAKKTLGSQTFDYETTENREVEITIYGMPLRVLLEDKKYSPEDSVELTLEKNVTISIPKSSALVRIEGKENEVFSEPADAFPKLSIKSNGKNLTWKCNNEWSPSAYIDITFECTPDLEADRELVISSVGSHSFTFEEDGSIHMGNTVLRPKGFKEVNLTVTGKDGDTITIKGLTADTTITSSSGKGTVATAKEKLQFETLEKNEKKNLEGFNHELTITRNK